MTNKAEMDRAREAFEKFVCPKEVMPSAEECFRGGAEWQASQTTVLTEHQQELAKLIGITYDADLGAEGCGWEIPMEPEPDYFETFDEAVLAFVEMITKEVDRLAAWRASQSAGEGWISAAHIAKRLMESVNDEWCNIEFDGCEVEDMLIAAGLYEQVDVTGPCGEDCRCIEYGFPTKCNKVTALGRAVLALPSPPKEKGKS